MAGKFISKKEFDRFVKNLERRLTGIGVRESIKAPSPEQAQSEDFPDEVMAVRNDRDADYTESTTGRWGTFIYKDIPKRDFNMRILVHITITFGIDDPGYAYFRLRDGVSGYDAAGTVRGTCRTYVESANTYACVSLSAFFDIPAGENHKICCDVRLVTAARTLTVYGNTNLEGANTGGCEIRVISVGRY